MRAFPGSPVRRSYERSAISNPRRYLLRRSITRSSRQRARGDLPTWGLGEEGPSGRLKAVLGLLNWQCVQCGPQRRTPVAWRNVILASVSRCGGFVRDDRSRDRRRQLHSRRTNAQSDRATSMARRGFMAVRQRDGSPAQGATCFYSFQIKSGARVRVGQSL
jgi:hypothetical protein